MMDRFCATHICITNHWRFWPISEDFAQTARFCWGSRRILVPLSWQGIDQFHTSKKYTLAKWPDLIAGSVFNQAGQYADSNGKTELATHHFFPSHHHRLRTLHLSLQDSWGSWLRWLPTCPKAVIHPTTNCDQYVVTSLIKNNALVHQVNKHYQPDLKYCVNLTQIQLLELVNVDFVTISEEQQEPYHLQCLHIHRRCHSLLFFFNKVSTKYINPIFWKNSKQQIECNHSWTANRKRYASDHFNWRI